MPNSILTTINHWPIERTGDTWLISVCWFVISIPERAVWREESASACVEGGGPQDMPLRWARAAPRTSHAGAAGVWWRAVVCSAASAARLVGRRAASATRLGRRGEAAQGLAHRALCGLAAVKTHD